MGSACFVRTLSNAVITGACILASYKPSFIELFTKKTNKVRLWLV